MAGISLNLLALQPFLISAALCLLKFVLQILRMSSVLFSLELCLALCFLCRQCLMTSFLLPHSQLSSVCSQLFRGSR